MERNQDSLNQQPQNELSGNKSSTNQQDSERNAANEEVKQKKDESESYMDYNGNSEANAPARARE